VTLLPRTIAALYRLTSRRPVFLYAATLAFVLAGLWGGLTCHMAEDITVMLPDSDPLVIDDFTTIQQAPFAKKVLVQLEAENSEAVGALTAAADDLSAKMGAPWFTAVSTGISTTENAAGMFRLLDYLPELATDQDIEKAAERLAPGPIAEYLDQCLARIQSIDGLLIKMKLKKDPVNLFSLITDKLASLSPISNVSLQDGHFVSRDGRHALIIAETDIPLTDSLKSKELVEHLQALAGETLPDDISATFISSHFYTTANAEIIKRDAAKVLWISSIALLLLFCFFLRSWRIVFVLLLPASVVGAAIWVTAQVFSAVSGITVGFGAVLLGITVDFALHVYFAVRRRKEQSVAFVLEDISRPILFSALTTIGAFSVLFLSSIPGQRQLALFSIAAIAFALLLAMAVLPHLAGRENAETSRRFHFKFQISNFKFRRHRKWIICIWAATAAVMAWQATGVRFNGDMRAVSYIPESLSRAENQIQETWGDIRSKALVVATGKDLESAMAANDKVYETLTDNGLAGTSLSISPVWPSEKKQAENRRRWTAFWNGERETISDALREAGQTLGYSATAFDTYLGRMDSAEEKQISAEVLEAAGLGEMKAALLMQGENETRILTLVEDTPEAQDLFAGETAGESSGRLVSQSRLRDEISGLIKNDFRKSILVAAGFVIFLLACLFRDLKKVVVSLLPVATGILVMLGIMGWRGLEFNLFNVVATILVIGLGVDYGIFMVSEHSGDCRQETTPAVLFSGVTTIFGLGSLAVATHPALHSIGISVFLGIAGMLPTALLVVPVLIKRKDLP
jgi:predicted exporter